MPLNNTVYLHVWSGDTQGARETVAARYPGAEIVELSHRELRVAGWKGQVNALRGLKGRALVFYLDSVPTSKYATMLLWTSFLHGCRDTVLTDASGRWQTFRRRDCLWLFPKTLISLVIDAAVLAYSFVYLKLWSAVAKPEPHAAPGDPDIAYLIAAPLKMDSAGGAASHIRGFLSGVESAGKTCRVFAGAEPPQDSFPTEIIPSRRKWFLLWESVMLSYNFVFAREVRRKLHANRPGFFYQRHGRFSVAGAMLSRRMKVPLMLEYNGSEIWVADYWDPVLFRAWLSLCEEIAIRSAAAIAVVSEPLRQELIGRGIPAERVLVNPNAVDPDYFHPGSGGEVVRSKLGIAIGEVVIGFVGSFSLWHGIEVLQQAIARLLSQPQTPRLYFVLIGQGLLHSDMRDFLKEFESSGQVIFTGVLPHDEVRSYLDATDILASPHVPMPDGTPFFGSPTKLFEYMAMGKAIVASNLDQLSQVLSHNETALLVTPGSVEELVDAVRLLASDPPLRERLGHRAREVAVEGHSWKQNAAKVLDAMAHNSEASAPPKAMAYAAPKNGLSK